MPQTDGSSSLIEAICGRGWDAPVAVDLERARALLPASGATLHAAAAAGDVAAVRAFLAAGPDRVHERGGPRNWEPLLYAAASHAHAVGRAEEITETVRVLLEAGADPDSHYSADGADNGFSALYLTISVSQHRRRTDALLAAGAHPSDGNSSYHAVETFDLDLLQALGAAGLDPDDVSYTIKHAIDMGWDAAILYLLSLGADPDAVHPLADETTLHWAVKRNASPRVIDALVAAGADPNRPTRPVADAEFGPQAWTPLDYARRLGHAHAVQALEAAGGVVRDASPAGALVIAVASGSADAARALLDAGATVPAAGPGLARDWVARWAQHGRSEAVDLACTLGFPLDGAAWMGLTALHWAALRGDAAMVARLLAAGAPNVDLGGYFGTPRHTASTCQWYAGDYPAVLALLPDG